MSSADHISQPLSAQYLDAHSEYDITTLPSLLGQMVHDVGYTEGGPSNKIGQVTVESSKDVQIGDKHIYLGPVTVRQVVNSDPVPTSPGDETKDKLRFRCDNVSGTWNRSVNSVDQDGTRNPRSNFRTGYLWIRNHVRKSPLKTFICLALLMTCFVTSMMIINTGLETDELSDSTLQLISRQQWLARPPVNDTVPIKTPVPYVVIHQTESTPCFTKARCISYLRNIQEDHIAMGWNDIGYNFMIGGDGAAYIGRGWSVLGASTRGWNDISIGIAFIGNFSVQTPSDSQISACQKLISQGVEQGYMKKNYKLFGARQLFDTDSPGDKLYSLIQKWSHWNS